MFSDDKYTKPTHSTPCMGLQTGTYYAATAQPWSLQVPLTGRISSEVCVVGAGLAGLSTALNLVEKGFQVVLLEAHTVGCGASGRNGGQVIHGFACTMDSLEQQLGQPDARALWQMSVDAVEIIDRRIKQHAIDCDWTRGYCSVALKPRHMKALIHWEKTAQKHYGYPYYQLWSRALLQEQCTSERYIGGLFDPLSGHLHPLNYTLGLARALLIAGGVLYEHSAVQSVQIDRQRPLVRTQYGEVDCQVLVLACNTLNGALLPELEKRIMPVWTYMIATAPLPPARAQGLIANNMALCDTRFVLDYFRLSADKRLLFGGGASHTKHMPRHWIRQLRHHMLKVFPQLSDVPVEYAWGGQVDSTLNRAPDFGRLAKHTYYLQGFSGHGLNLTNLAGQLVAEAVALENSRFELFTRIRHRPFPRGPTWRRALLMLGTLYYRLRDAL